MRPGHACFIAAVGLALAHCSSKSTTSAASSYQVGGTVTGLSGSGLILQNNGGDDLAVAANGTFAFATRVATGASYSVTVLAQPANPAQTCTVSGGAGTVEAGSVSSVVIRCTINSYMVRVAVSGLVGTGLKLQNNGSDDLAVAANGTFAFATPIASGASYSVTVLAQPANPWQTCVVSAGIGTIGGTDVLANVTCVGAAVIQRWTAPTTWGRIWPDSPTMVQHAYFDGTQLVETRGITWATIGTLPAQRPFTGFPSGTRYGAGPFSAGRYQATTGDDGLNITGDMLVCAVVKPDYNPVVDGHERVIIAKGQQGESGWVLMQMHSSFCFHYQSASGWSMIWTETHFPNWGTDDTDGPLNPSYVVVCAGREGNNIHIAANSVADTMDDLNGDLGPASTSYPPGTLMVATSRPATIGGYSDGDSNHVFPGRVYETAVWNEPASAANMQARFGDVQGLAMVDGTFARYTRGREGPFVGADGAYHTTWRHGPRIDPVKGFLFGLQSWNRISYPEELEFWTGTGGASVVANQIEPPGDSEHPSADLVTLGPGQSLSPSLAGVPPFAAGPIHGQIWIQRVSKSGVLRIRNAPPGSGGGGQIDIDLSTLPDSWTRVWLRGLSADVNGNANIYLEAPSSVIQFYAWGADLTQIGGGGDLGSFDPGPVMYDWSGNTDTSDQLQLSQVSQSTGTDGYCLSVEAQPPDGLGWAAPFPKMRVPLEWNREDYQAASQIRVEGGSGGRVCFNVSNGGFWYTCWQPSSWTPGSKHNVKGCVTPAGDLKLYADDAQVGDVVKGVIPPDLSTGHITIGNGDGSLHDTPWHGYVSKALVCKGTQIADCE